MEGYPALQRGSHPRGMEKGGELELMGSQSRGGGDLGFGGKEARTLHGPVVRGGLETLIQNPRHLAESNLANYSTLYCAGSPIRRLAQRRETTKLPRLSCEG